ncbi:MAG: amidohydrolase family protein, partial [Myxococcota bacterium]|nr:amidohydrolase family protein [Myxococcota bacterium]
RAAGRVRMVTLAPEVEGAEALLDALGRHGVVAALGHSLADDAAMTHAIARGARHVTHLFNAMGGLHHRHRGVAGVALADDRLTCDLICDGVHVHPDVVRIAARAKDERLLWITDRVDPSRHGWGAGEVHDDGRALRLPDGTLAGSSLGMDRAVRNAVAFGACTRLEAVAAATLRPARLLGLEAERGTLRPGARADLVVLDDAGRVAETWLAGAPAWRADAPD